MDDIAISCLSQQYFLFESYQVDGKVIIKRLCAMEPHLLSKRFALPIHVIFSSSQIGRFGISQREIGVSDREILLCGTNISNISKILALLTLLKINFFILGCHNPIIQLSS